MKPEDATALDKSRGYSDIDPDNAWYDWQMLRRSMGRKPGLDPGIRATMISADDKGYLEAVQRARGALAEFRAMIERHGLPALPMIRHRIEDSGVVAHLWLVVTEVRPDGFSAEMLEKPIQFKEHDADHSFDVGNAELEDWMMILDGVLHGGYTVRYQRSLLREDEKPAFDEHMGVTSYSQL
jgi:uncharacterized protein YegJ (DUF2314 family)